MHNTLLQNEMRNIEKNFKVHGNRNYDDLLNDNQLSNNLPNHTALMDNFARRDQHIQQQQMALEQKKNQKLQRGPFYERQHIADPKDPIGLLLHSLKIENVNNNNNSSGGKPAFPYGEAIDPYGRVINRETGNIMYNGGNVQSLGMNHRQPYDRNGPISFKTNNTRNSDLFSGMISQIPQEKKRRNSKSRNEKKSSSRNKLPVIDSNDVPTMERRGR